MTLIKSILAGVMISIGCRVYLMCDNKYIGALLFCVGLISILMYEFNLYTGKVCYIPQNGIKFIVKVIIILGGNIVGCLCVGMMFPSEIAKVLCENKLKIGLYEVFFKAIMCNILIYISVDAYKVKHTLLPTVFCIPTFILSGYEHSVADIGYFVMAKQFSKETILFLIVVIIGNAIGGMVIPTCKILCDKINLLQKCKPSSISIDK